MARNNRLMLCAYCGHQTHAAPAASPTDSFELQSPNLSFQSCNHQADLQRLKERDYPAYLQTLFLMVGQQISSIEEIEVILEKKKTALMTRVKEFVELNGPKLTACATTALLFNENFSKLGSIRVEPPFTAWISPDLASYFDRPKLVAWSEKCLQNTLKIQKKIQTFEREFFPEFLRLLAADAEALDSACQSLRSRFALHRRLMEAEGLSTTQNAHHQKTIEEIFEKLNGDAKVFIKERSDKLNALLKKTNTKLSQSIFLVSENVSELVADVKIIGVFEEIEQIVASCIDEMTKRANFETVYRRLVSLLNLATEKENQRRTEFVAGWGEKIPSQMFPDIRQRVKLLNEELFFPDGLSAKVGTPLLSPEDLGKLDHVAEVVGALV